MGFQQGLSGLNATSKNLQIIGNNIANANTFGTKVARAEFSDMYAAALNGAGTNAIGIGTNLASVAQQFTQGNISTTENPMDLAINGAGFFQVTDGKSPVTFTRNGQFKVDKDGFIVNNSLQKLMGYAASGTGQIQPGLAVPLQLPTAAVAPQATTEITMELNLQSASKVTVPGSGPAVDFNDASTYNNATSMTVYDMQGQPVALTYYFQKAAADTWNVYVTANGDSLSGTNSAPSAVTTMSFSADGKSTTSPTWPVALAIPATTGAGGVTTIPIANINLDMGKATQFGMGFGVTAQKQDGFAAGQLTAISVESNGVIMARYSNGQSQAAGQIEVATFRNPQGLQPIGDNAWARTFASGDPVTGVPGDGNLGVLQAGALEDSNIDLTGELVNMIMAQRIYQANAQSIKTEDQVLQTLVNIR